MCAATAIQRSRSVEGAGASDRTHATSALGAERQAHTPRVAGVSEEVRVVLTDAHADEVALAQAEALGGVAAHLRDLEPPARADDGEDGADGRLAVRA